MEGIRVAVIQASSVAFNSEESLGKLEAITKTAAAKGAKLILFPEAFISCYPRGSNFGAIIGSRSKEGREYFLKYWKSSVEVPGPIVDQLSAIAKDNKVILVVGVIEREGTTLYCCVLFFDENGTYLGKHRKLTPTASERVVWGNGDGSTIPVFETSVGKIGAVICWENYMPLLRMTMYAKGIQIYCAATADAREEWISSMRHIALEGRCFVLSCNQFSKRSDYPKDFVDPQYEALQRKNESEDYIMCRGGSCIINPLGQFLVEPVYGKEDILYANLDMDDIVRGKFDFDVVGHYSRPDVFTLSVNEKANKNVVYHGNSGEQESNNQEEKVKQ